MIKFIFNILLFGFYILGTWFEFSNNRMHEYKLYESLKKIIFLPSISQK